MPKTPPVESEWKAERERLASELQRLEEALLDARSGSGDNEDGSLVAKLREATKKRVRIEEEFERSSDRWRDERRNLTAEIDQLDRALTKARAEVRKGASGQENDDPHLRRELNEAVEARRVLEQKLAEEKAKAKTSAEELKEKVAELETSLVDALERANNASRGDEAREAAFKAQVEKHRQSIESEMRAEFEASLAEHQQAVKTLEDERAQLHLEIHRLKSAAEQTRTEPEPSPEAKTSRFSLKKLRKGRTEPTPTAAADPTLTARVADLEKQLTTQTSRAEEADRRATSAEARVEELRQAAATPAPDEVSGRADWDAERARLEARILELEAATEPSTSSDTDAHAAELDGLRAEGVAWTQEREALKSKVGELEASLERASETGADAQKTLADLETQIAERDRSLADLTAKMEAASSAWDEEREALGVHTKSLEAALADAESLGASSSEAASEAHSQLEAGQKAIEELEARYREDSENWETERSELLAKASELEFSLEDARAGQADVTSQYEQLLADFEEARKTGNALREQIGVDTKEWSDEQVRLRNEVEELKASLKEARDADASSDAKTRKLIARLEASEKKLDIDSEQWGSERKKLEASVRDLEHKLEDTRLETETARKTAETQIAEVEAARQTALTDLEATRGQLEAATAEWTAQSQTLEARTGDLEREVEALRQSEAAASQQHEQDLAKARETAAQGHAEFEAEKDRLLASSEELAYRVRELEASLEAAHRKEEETAQEGANLTAALAEAQQTLATLKEESGKQAEEWERERSEYREELKKLRENRSQGKSLKGSKTGQAGSGNSVADLEARRQALEVRLLESEESKEELAASLQAATEEWDSERNRLAKQLGDMDQAIESASKKDKAELDARHAELMQKLQEAETKYSSLEEESLKSAKAWDEQRAQLEQEIAQWEQQVVAEAERVAEETKQALQKEYDMQLKELQGQKEQLEAQLKSPQAMTAGSEADPAVIAQEMDRVDAEIDEINQLIEDPNAALSNVMRKNAERSELKAYRRGLSYLAERIANESKGE